MCVMEGWLQLCLAGGLVPVPCVVKDFVILDLCIPKAVVGNISSRPILWRGAAIFSCCLLFGNVNRLRSGLVLRSPFGSFAPWAIGAGRLRWCAGATLDSL